MPEFKQAKRKNLRASKSRIEYLQFQFDGIRTEISERAGHDEYDRIANTLTNTIKKLDSEIKVLPLRHEYRGTFYIRKPYTQPLQSIKVEDGVASMRECLVTWEVRDKDNNYIVATRDIFRNDGLTDRIVREDGVAVFVGDED